MLTAGCADESTTPTTETVRATVTASASTPVPAEVLPPAVAPDQSWTVPDLRGRRNLQKRGGRHIQQLTNNEVFYTGSTDLTGGRQKSNHGSELAGMYLDTRPR